MQRSVCPLIAGNRLGPYEILAPIGAGGMGEVYRARDTRLDRIVALKVSAGQFSDRFEREARSVAALNHPNICTLHDVGPNYLVMEYIDGHILKGPLSLDTVLQYAIQICDALDAAHRKGIVHRDLKPANILVSRSGIKLLDFGLAKWHGKASPGEATETIALTKEHTLIGTIQYMSPEQLEGKDADARSDIFSFGLVLFEMLTGKRAFEGSSAAGIMGAILERETPSAAGAAPPAVDRLLGRCLAKQPDERWQTACDLKAELQWIASSGTVAATASSAPTAASARGIWRERAAWSAAAVFLLSAILLAVWPRRTPAGEELVRFAVYPPHGMAFSRTGNATVPIPQFAISPDGHSIVFTATPAGGSPILWLRSMDEVTAHPLSGTEQAIGPFWSPDSNWVCFFAGGKLKKVRAAGGAVQVIAEAVPELRGGTQGGNGMILFGSGSNPLQGVESAGGPIRPVTSLDTARGDMAHWWPHFLPDGRHFLFLARSSSSDQRGIFAGSTDGHEKKLLIRGKSSASYAAPGYLLWIEGDTLLGQHFDADHLELSGQPVTIAQQVNRSSADEAAVSASATGTLAYTSSLLQLGRPTWFDRSGKSLGSPLVREGDYVDFRLSPDDSRLAVSLVDPKTGYIDIWITDLGRGTTSRFTEGRTVSSQPVWAPDGTRLVYRTNPRSVIEFYQKSALGGGNEQPVLSAEAQRAADLHATNLIPTDWSLDGRNIIYSTPELGSGFDLWMLPMGVNAKPVKYLGSSADEMHGNFSPNGRLVAYSSNESGRFEVYVETFPRSDRKVQVSTNGGYEPRWRADGREIYYLSEDRKLTAVAVGDGPSFKVPETLFQTAVPPGVDAIRTHYVPSRDGRRFLVNTELANQSRNPITVVLNWTGALRK